MTTAANLTMKETPLSSPEREADDVVDEDPVIFCGYSELQYRVESIRYCFGKRQRRHLRRTEETDVVQSNSEVVKKASTPDARGTVQAAAVTDLADEQRDKPAPFLFGNVLAWKRCRSWRSGRRRSER